MMASFELADLLNIIHLNADPDKDDKTNSQEIVDYCETRFRVILQRIQEVTIENQSWMVKILFKELVRRI